MAHPPELYLSYELFTELARGLVARSDTLQDGWELKTTKEAVFLVKRCSLTEPLHRDRELDDGETELGIEDTGDCAQLSQPQADCVTVCMEYHVVYSLAYSVPVLYFRASYPDGKQLSLAQVWKLVSNHLFRNEQNYWGLVTQNEHPLLGQPFYHIHPCHTAKVMGNVPSQQLNYLVSWLSMFGAVVGLPIPPTYINTQ